MKRTMTSVVLASLVISLFCAAVPVRLRAEKYETFYNLFVDLENWDGEDPEGAAVDVPGMNMLQSTRTYAKDKSELNAMIIIGNSAMTGMFTGQAEMNYESEDSKAMSREIDGFMVYTIYDKKKNSGAVAVLLLPGEEENALFVLAFDGIGEDEGFEIAKKFDWKEMKKRVESLD